MEEHSYPVEPHDHPEINAAISDLSGEVGELRATVGEQQAQIEAIEETQTELVAIAERQQMTMEMIQDAIPSFLLCLGIIVGVLFVSIFSSGMRNAS